MKYLFGPVNSRRLGLSLGVDIVPYKTCTLNCIYCECGPTTLLTSRIAEYVPTGEVIGELDMYLSGAPGLDVITFSGAGEPTLHSGLGKIIRHIKDRFPQYRVAVLTNSTLIHMPVVRESLMHADMVIPSLDAVSQEVFDRMLRPVSGVKPETIIEGLALFRKEFRGELVLEIFIVPGMNDTDKELNKLKEAGLKIMPDRIQLNSLDRPGTEKWVTQVSAERLKEIRDFLIPLRAEIAGDPGPQPAGDSQAGDMAESVMSVLRRRPSTVDDLSRSLGIGKGELTRLLRSLAKGGRVVVERLDRGDFYRLP